MHPAPSVIIFSTLSGAGFGLLFFLGIGLPVVTGWIAFGFYLIAFGLSTGGLLAATFHLKNRRNAWKSYREWRTSWLSREAWAAVAALLVMALHAAGQVFLGITVAPLGWIGAGLSLATVLTTAMIYAQLRTVPRWNQWATPVVFLSVALSGGALLSNNAAIAAPLLLLSGAAVLFHWWNGDRRFRQVGTTPNSAIGLAGSVSLWERPHTGENYLTREMVFRIGRKHAVKLRVIAFVLLIVIPFGIALTTLHHWNAAIAILSYLAGVATQRWLFFAEAEHVVGLYYGAHAEKAAA